MNRTQVPQGPAREAATIRPPDIADLAALGGVIIGHGMAVDRPASQFADRTLPPEDRVTEIGVVVADPWQGRGVGSALVRVLISRAQARGVTSLSMDILPANQQVLAMIAAHWPAAPTQRHADCVTVQAALLPEQRTVPAPAAWSLHDPSSPTNRSAQPSPQACVAAGSMPPAARSASPWKALIGATAS